MLSHGYFHIHVSSPNVDNCFGTPWPVVGNSKRPSLSNAHTDITLGIFAISAPISPPQATYPGSYMRDHMMYPLLLNKH